MSDEIKVGNTVFVSEFERLKWQKEQIEHRQQRAIERKVAEQCAEIAERKIEGTLPLTGDEIARIIRQEFGVNH
jgi:hypothetical protein